MYSRSFYPEQSEQALPENYVGTAFTEAGPSSDLQETAQILSDGDSLPAIAPTSGDGFLTSIARFPFISKLFENIPSIKVPKIGSEEMLIIAIAALLFFSKGGDKECALILLSLLFIDRF